MSTSPASVAVAPSLHLVPGEQDDAEGRDRRADRALRVEPIAEECDRETDGEEDLELDHQRRQAGRHAELHAEKQQSELEHADREAVSDDRRKRHSRRAHEEHQRHCREEKAQRCQRERGNLAQSELDRHEREAPQCDDEEDEREVARCGMCGHAASLAPGRLKPAPQGTLPSQIPCRSGFSLTSSFHRPKRQPAHDEALAEEHQQHRRDGRDHRRGRHLRVLHLVLLREARDRHRHRRGLPRREAERDRELVPARR